MCVSGDGHKPAYDSVLEANSLLDHVTQNEREKDESEVEVYGREEDEVD